MADPKQSSLTEEKTNVTGSRKEEKESMFHGKETHGRSEDIDEKTRVDDVKGPGVLGRMKEEVEAIVDAVTPTKSSDK
ncbi:PREDICTED: uncharacterized protein LOC109128797 [Camelina sativa]|uniref:Uncharacterized protein LOC109128797 n=1 Tax=Camelina sativa TaxID=90675 RepID=A0ABM1QX59_CAMSA|nr:PREDICTED: uncharacterized protein LOC109128797 [Camelina sativa]